MCGNKPLLIPVSFKKKPFEKKLYDDVIRASASTGIGASAFVKIALGEKLYGKESYSKMALGDEIPQIKNEEVYNDMDINTEQKENKKNTHPQYNSIMDGIDLGI